MVEPQASSPQNIISSPTRVQVWRQESDTEVGVEAVAMGGTQRRGWSEKNEALRMNLEPAHHPGEEARNPGSSR